MTRIEFAQLAAGMKAIYAEPTFMTDDLAMDMWYRLLKDLPYELASKATEKYMSTISKTPRPADIRAMAASIMEPEEQQISEVAAWQLVYKAISNSNYNAESEFAKLPPACQEAVGTPYMLKEWAQMDTETVQSVEQSHFIKSYRSVLERARIEARTSPELRSQIEGYRLSQAQELTDRGVAVAGIAEKKADGA